VRPKLIFEKLPPTVQGYGFEAVQLTVQAMGLPNPGRHTVLLTADKGQIESDKPGEVGLDNRGIGSALLRSGGLGTALVTARLDILRGPEQQTVDFVAPVSFLAWALGGGLFGGFARLLAKRRALSAKSAARAITAGVLLGLLVAVAYTQGVKLVTIPVAAGSGQALVALLAAFTALVDPAEQIKRLTTAVSGKAPE
jgi:hypothetical protein